MKQNQAVILIVAILVLFFAGILFYFQKDIVGFTKKTDTKKEIISTIDTNRIPCPLLTEECVYSSIFESKAGNISYIQIGHYNVASTSPIFAVFDGELDYLDTNRLNEKRVTITSGQYVAVYRFIGDFSNNIAKGAVKKGQMVGLLTQRISHFEKKYNFVFGINDVKGQKPVKFEFNEGKTSIKIID